MSSPLRPSSSRTDSAPLYLPFARRYEREHNQGHRSAIQRIQEQDSPASLSMVLCVSSIQWFKAPVPDVGARDAPPAGTMIAAMELTDGWYRIKATSDVVLSGAVTRGKLRVGCKIGLSGVRVSRFSSCYSFPLSSLRSSFHFSVCDGSRKRPATEATSVLLR